MSDRAILAAENRELRNALVRIRSYESCHCGCKKIAEDGIAAAAFAGSKES